MVLEILQMRLEDTCRDGHPVSDCWPETMIEENRHLHHVAALIDVPWFTISRDRPPQENHNQ
jgi:hypothetical protein